MKKIVAIGGGEIGRPGTKIETEKIDREIIRLTGKKHPKLLFLPTTSSDSESYYEVVKGYFGKRLGCKTDVLYLINTELSKREIAHKILSADIAYVGGGNTQMMLRVWKRHGVDIVLRKAWNKGIVLSGLSAGSMCWFKGGVSDSRRFANPDADLIAISGLGFIPALHTPHYNVEKDRRPGLKKLMRKKSGVALAVDNCCAIEFVGETYRVVSSKADANAYKVYWKSHQYVEAVIPKAEAFRPIKELLTK